MIYLSTTKNFTRMNAWSDALSKRFTRKKTQNYRYFFYFIGLESFFDDYAVKKNNFTPFLVSRSYGKLPQTHGQCVLMCSKINNNIMKTKLVRYSKYYSVK